jgi:hypothetical protein
MVCGIRNYVCRVSKTDSCSKFKSIYPKKKKRYTIGVGYPWYMDAFVDFGSQRQTTHGLGCIKLYDKPLSADTERYITMLDPKGTHNGKKYRLILEEV